LVETVVAVQTTVSSPPLYKPENSLKKKERVERRRRRVRWRWGKK
jgi:hypothetical protein